MPRRTTKSASAQSSLTLAERYPFPPVFRCQLVREMVHGMPGIEQPDDVAELLESFLSDADREHFVVIGLTAKNAVIGLNVVSIGSLTAAMVPASQVFKAAILMNATAIIVAHNHPSGDPTPSFEDFEVTAKLRKLGDALDIPVMDHMIMGSEGRHVSIRHTDGWRKDQ